MMPECRRLREKERIVFVSQLSEKMKLKFLYHILSVFADIRNYLRYVKEREEGSAEL